MNHVGSSYKTPPTKLVRWTVNLIKRKNSGADQYCVSWSVSFKSRSNSFPKEFLYERVWSFWGYSIQVMQCLQLWRKFIDAFGCSSKVLENPDVRFYDPRSEAERSKTKSFKRQLTIGSLFLAVRLSSYGYIWEVAKHPRSYRATLMPLSCLPTFKMHPQLDRSTVKTMNQLFYNIAVAICARKQLLFEIDFEVLTTRFVAFDFVMIRCFRFRFRYDSLLSRPALRLNHLQG